MTRSLVEQVMTNLLGGTGKDLLIGGAGNDLLIGGAGSDTESLSC